MVDNDPFRFEQVLQAELNEVDASRKARSGNPIPENSDASQRAANGQLIGLAFSGGGTRSATFNLGILQALARFGLLSRVDYLSSVGGGSYIAGWLAAWLSRSGFEEVEAQLGGAKPSKAGHSEAPEIQRLRKTTGQVLSRRHMSWVRNVILNLIIVAFVLGGLMLLANALIAFPLRIVFEKPFSLTGPYIGVAAAFLAVVAALATAIVSSTLDHEHSPGDSARSVRWVVAVGTFAAGTLLAVWINAFAQANPSPKILSIFTASTEWRWTVPAGCWLAIMCICGSRSSDGRSKLGWAHVASATVAGLFGGLLLFGLRLLSRLSPGEKETFFVPLTIGIIVLTGLAYMLLVGKRMPGKQAKFARWLGTCLTGGAIIWIFIVALWWEPESLQNAPTLSKTLLNISGALVTWGLVIGGLFGAVAQVSSRWLRTTLQWVTHVAPYSFVVGFSVLVMLALKLSGLGLASFPADANISDAWAIGLLAIAALLLLAIAALLMWQVRTNEFWKQSYYRANVTSNYLASSGGTGDDDILLSNLASGPYPLFNATLNTVETDAAGSQQVRVLPFIFAPKYSGRSSKSSKPDSYRPTEEFAGGVSLGTAIALGEPSRKDCVRPPSTAVAFLWAVFDLRSGRWLGNPSRRDTWRNASPRTGMAYPLVERSVARKGQPGYVHLSDGGQFDNLGIYQLVQRQCRFIIACDASEDPNLTFEDLAETIQKCRTDFGAEFEIEVAPLRQTKMALANAHCQAGVVRYANGSKGWFLYIRPSLTGDESPDLLTYASAPANANFPRAANSLTEFDDGEFESYRQLGQHILQTLLKEVGGENLAQMPVDQLFAVLRQRLQPDFKDAQIEVEPLPAKLPETPPADLIEAIASGECVLCGGSGLAAQAGLPTWRTFLQGMLRFAREKGFLDATSEAGLAATMAAGELEAAADEITHQVPREPLLEYVQNSISGSQPSKAHQLLAELPFLGALNTNLDDLLGAAFAHRGSSLLVAAQTNELVAALQAKKFFVANIFGTPSQPASPLFTTKEFRALLSANTQFKQFLSTVFLRCRVLFVGFGIDGIRDYIEALELPHIPERRHYAIVGYSGQLDPVKLRYLERSYNLYVIAYRTQLDYEELPEFLERITSVVREKAPHVKTRHSLVLKSVTLKNIGPFESLHLDLTPSWNLLLGDNGVGKTVILRAIAAALCGDKADAAAVTRLLRSDSKEGSICLNVESREYSVKLDRDVESNDARIKSVTLSPLGYDNWLVLGFPALRSIPWERPEGPSAPKQERPSAKDLQPILKGDPDDRIADIKQWLINLDYASRSEAQPSPSRKLLDAFFEILNRLTPDLHVSLHSIDPKTMEIKVETDAGIVPLETISQGTGSVMCWIGTLLERLSQVNDTAEPTKGRALVLIDELDAHMHPKWQQLFVSAFREQFPAVQVIATTHSPLIVVGLDQSELWLLQRDQNTKQVTAERPRSEMKGWRADQMLTGPLFNLPSSIDPKLYEATKRYTALAAREDLGDAEMQELEELSGEINVQMPSAKEREEARLAFELIEDSLNHQLQHMGAEKQKRILDEAKVQMQETITGSRRPT